MRGNKAVIGLVGGIGSGKSRVAAEFSRLGCLVVDSDRLNHEVLDRPEVAAQLRDWWGPRVLDEAGRPRRKRVAEIIFGSAGEKERLERLVHPLIEQRRLDIIQAVETDSAVKAIVIDSPLLLESNLARECDSIVFVNTDEHQRLERLRRKRGWTAEELKRREIWQLPLDEKRSRAEFVIDNNGPDERLHPQVAEILRTIVARHSKAQ